MRPKTAILVAPLAILLVVVLVVVGLMAWVTGRGMPETDATLRLAGLDQPVTITRDANGLINITADTPHDLFMAQGYVHAQERMWQMEVWRRISAGRLSELFGEGTVDQDRFIRTVGWWEAAKRDLAAFEPETLATLDAYTAGVNAWLDTHRDSLGLPFIATGSKPEPWTNLDTAAWVKVQAWNLGGNLQTEIFRYLADARLGDPAKTDELFPPYPEGAPVITPSGLAGSGGAGADAGLVASDASHEPEVPILTSEQATAWRAIASLGSDVMASAGLSGGDSLTADRGIGSNDWVIGPSRSKTGGALLANDPHLGISMPSIWIINGLHCRTVSDACPYDAAGVSFPGAPGIILGHNARIAWGATNVDPDVQDLVIETVDPADPGKYLFKDESRPFTTRQEQIAVSGGETVTLDVRESQHGPILNDVDSRLADAPPMAFRWSALQSPDHTLDAVLKLQTAANYDDFRAALSTYGAPSQNFVYADVEGHIGYQMPGYIPIRSDPSDRGDRPVPGADGQHEWVGQIPFDDLPRQLDPDDGWVVTANNAAVDDDYPYFIANDWDPGYRAERILELLGQITSNGLTGVDLDDIGAIQNDTVPLRARGVPDLLVDATDPGEGGVAPRTEPGAQIRSLIRSWDGACDVGSAGCAAYMSWEYRVLGDLFDDDLGLTIARDYVGGGASWVTLGRLLKEPKSAWWDDLGTVDVVETRDDIVARAMDEAGAELTAALGPKDRWSWGRLHTATFREQTLGESGIGPLEWYFNDGPYPAPGTDGAVNATGYWLGSGYPDPDDPDAKPATIAHVFDVTSLPSYRLAIDMSDLDGARIIITTGQSGHPFSRHSGDMIDPWLSGGTVPFPFSADAIAKAAVSTLTLTP